VQTPHYLVIVNEMVHDVRIVRMAAQHTVPTIRQWLGDSIGRLNGDMLVVETTNFTDKTDFSGSSENRRVIERFTLASPDTLRYQFTIDDAAASFTRPWSGMLWMTGNTRDRSIYPMRVSWRTLRIGWMTLDICRLSMAIRIFGTDTRAEVDAFGSEEDSARERPQFPVVSTTRNRALLLIMRS
jgi:hypothetical protein